MELYHILIRVQSSPASAFCRGRKQSLPVVVLKRADRDAHSFRQLSHGHEAIRQRPFIFWHLYHLSAIIFHDAASQATLF